MDRTTHFYRDVLGFTVEGETAFTADAGIRGLTGLSKADVRRSRAQAPGSTLWIEFVGIQRCRSHAAAPADSGSRRRAASVARAEHRCDGERDEKRRNDRRLAGGGAVPIPPNFMGALVADPNNFFLTPFEPAAATATAGPARPLKLPRGKPRPAEATAGSPAAR